MWEVSTGHSHVVSPNQCRPEAQEARAEERPTHQSPRLGQASGEEMKVGSDPAPMEVAGKFRLRG